ncbi:hypothetical protein Btru_036172 [Bulinus truncatus]|nr:hypothetical protein Btru_036172 [Bulinus truncatus]
MLDHPLFGKCSNQMVDHPLFGLPDVARSMNPLLAALICIMKDMQTNASPTDAFEVLERKRECKRLLSRVYKQSLNLESQLHQYINPGLVTSLQKRTMRATGQIDVIVKLIKKLRKESRKACYDLDSRRKTCEISVQLKSLLAQQKCEWQCVGRLKETLTMAKEITSLLKFICKLTSLIEQNGDALRRIYEGPPPYEYRSPYDDLHNNGSSYCTGDNLDSSDVTPNVTQRCRTSSPPGQSQSEVTISLSFDYLRNSEKLSTSRSKHEMRSPRSRKFMLNVGSGASGAECGRENVNGRRSVSRHTAKEKNHRARGPSIKLYSVNPRNPHRSSGQKHPTKNRRRRRESDDQGEGNAIKNKAKKHFKKSKKTGSGHRSHASDKSVLCSKSCCVQCDSFPVSSGSRNADKCHRKKTKKTKACKLSDVESSRSDAQGHRSRSDSQCHRSRSDSQGHRSHSDSQGHRTHSDSQGNRYRSDSQGHRSRTKPQGHRSRSNPQGHRSKDKKKHKKKKIKYKIQPDKCKCCKRINLALDRCAHKQMSASVPACSVSKFYLHPVNSVNSFGSRQPLLFSSYESDYGYDFSESHKADHGGKHNKTHWRLKYKKSLEQIDERRDSTSSSNSCEQDCTTASAEVSWMDNTSIDCSAPCTKLYETCDDKRRIGGDNPVLHKSHRSSASSPSSKRTYCPKVQQSLSDCLSSTSQPDLQSFSLTAKSSLESDEVLSISSSIRVSDSLCDAMDSDSVTDSCFDCKDASRKTSQISATDLQTETLSKEVSIGISVSSKRSFVTADATATTRDKTSISCTSSYSDRLLFSGERDDQFCAQSGRESSRKPSAGHHTSAKTVCEKSARKHSSPNKQKMAKMSLSKLSIEFCLPKSHKHRTCFSPQKSSKHQQALDEASCTEPSDILSHMPTRRPCSNKEASAERNSVIFSKRPLQQLYLHVECSKEKQSVLNSERPSKQYVHEEYLPDQQSVVLPERPPRQICSPEECSEENRAVVLSHRSSRQSTILGGESSPRRQSLPLSERPRVLIEQSPMKQSMLSGRSSVQSSLHSGDRSVTLSPRVSRQSYVIEEGQSVVLTDRPSRKSNVADELTLDEQLAISSPVSVRRSISPEECITERQIASYVPEECTTEWQPVSQSKRPSRQSYVPEECITERRIASYGPEECIAERQPVLLRKESSRLSYVPEECSTERQIASYVPEECITERQPVMLCDKPSRQSYVPEECITERRIASYGPEECITERQPVLLRKESSRLLYVPEECINERHILSYVPEECITERQPVLLCEKPSRQSYAPEECITERHILSYVPEECITERQPVVLCEKPSRQSYVPEECITERHILSYVPEECITERQPVLLCEKPSRQSYVVEEKTILSQRPSAQLYQQEECFPDKDFVVLSKTSYIPEEIISQRQSPILSHRPSMQLHLDEAISPRRQSDISSQSSPKKQSPILSPKSSRQSYLPEEVKQAEEYISTQKSPRQSYLPEESFPQRKSPTLSQRSSRQSNVPEEINQVEQSIIPSQKSSRQTYLQEESFPQMQSRQSGEISPVEQLAILSQKSSRQSNLPEESSPKWQASYKQSYILEQISPAEQSIVLSRKSSRQSYLPEESSPQRQSPILSKRPSRQSYIPDMPDESYSDKKRASVLSSVSIESVLIGSPYLNKPSENPLTSSSQIITDSQYSFPAHQSPTKSSRKPSENQNASPSSTSLASKKSKKSVPRLSLTIPLDFVSAETNIMYPPRRETPIIKSPKNISPNKTSSKQSILDLNERRLSQDEPRLSQVKPRLSQDEDELSHPEEEPDDENETSLESSDNIPQSPQAVAPVREIPSRKMSPSPPRRPSSPQKKAFREEPKSQSPVKYQPFEEKLSAASRKSLGQPTSKRKLQEKVDNESTTTLESLPTEDNSKQKGYRKYWWILLLLLFVWCCFIYLLICYLTKPACTRCTLPLPNIIFYPLNKIVNSARLMTLCIFKDLHDQN